MTPKNVEMVIHPVRLRILLCLENEPLTTQEIANLLPDIPKSSLYRHLRLLLESDFVTVSEIRVVKGIQEKVYELSRPARLGPADIAGLTVDDHLCYFTTYLMTLLRGFSEYLSNTVEADFVADRVGYNEVSFWASGQELDVFSAKLNEALLSLIDNSAGQGRKRRKIAIISHPSPKQGKEHE